MSKFETILVEIRAIESITNADTIELAVIGEYRSIIKKGQFNKGDKAIYFCEDSILPDYIIERMGLVGKLSGSNKNRIKAVRLRGCLSQGILMKLDNLNGVEGVINNENKFIDIKNLVNKNLNDFFGIVKYEPIIPSSMAGSTVHLSRKPIPYFDLENFKKYNDIITSDDDIELTEKVHGTFCGFIYNTEVLHDDVFDNGHMSAFSKKLGHDNLIFRKYIKVPKKWYIKLISKIFKSVQPYTKVEVNLNNVYVNQMLKYMNNIKHLHNILQKPKTLLIFGEIYGPIQDLKYGHNQPQFALFDICYISDSGDVNYIDPIYKQELAKETNIPIVPSLYTGKFDINILNKFTIGKTVIGNNSHIREGVVIRLLKERKHDKIGRIILKSINPDYLTRKNKDATEYQ